MNDKYYFGIGFISIIFAINGIYIINTSPDYGWSCYVIASMLGGFLIGYKYRNKESEQ